MKDTIKEMLAFENLTEEEKSKKHILGRLYGPIADVVNPTRNGRKYSEQLWENVFDNPIMKEKFNNKVMYGELGHPADREEIDMEKIAICMPEPPKKDKDGHLIGYFDILDTPNGRILKTLCDYGSTLGISSRGTGDVITDDNGEEAVDPNTYDCECWDVVIVPAVESARLQFTEGLNKSKTMKQALCESLEKATAEDKKIMSESLENLGINLNETVSNPEKEENKLTESKISEQTNEKVKEANDVGGDVIKSLQESLKSNAELEEKVKNLQNELAVRDAKVEKLEEELNRSNSTIVRLTTLVKDSKAKTEKISTLESKLTESQNLVEELRSKTARQEEVNESVKTLKESISTKDCELSTLNEQLNTLKDSHAEEIKTLKESLESEKTSHTTEVNKLNESLNKSKKLIEDYTKLTNNIASKYIDVKATQLGVRREEILNRLDESYTLDQVDKICEDLMTYKVNMSKLPFVLDNKSVVKLRESKPIQQVAHTNTDDDSISEATLKMAGLL